MDHSLEFDAQNEQSMNHVLMSGSMRSEGEFYADIPGISGVSAHDYINVYCERCCRTTKKPMDLGEGDLRCQDCDTPPQYQCLNCNRLYRYLESALTHVRYGCSSRLPVLRCSQCSYRAVSKQNLKLHIGAVHEDLGLANAHACYLCGRAYKRRKHMLRHQKLCGKKPHIRCKLCQYRTKRNDHLRQHMQHRHPGIEIGGGSRRGPGAPATVADAAAALADGGRIVARDSCPKCGKTYKYHMALKSHIRVCEAAPDVAPPAVPEAPAAPATAEPSSSILMELLRS